MKKVLSVLGLLGILSFASPVNAAPPPPTGGHYGGQVVVSGSSYVNRPTMRRSYRYASPRHYGSGVFVRHGYWGNSCYGNRLGWFDNCYYNPCSPPPPPPAGFSTGFFINF